jgi:hypothetical protein
MRRRKALAALIAVTASLTAQACTRTPEQPPLRFDQVPPIRLAVASFTTEERMEPVAMGFIDRRRSDELINVTREYLSARIEAAGGFDQARGIIEEATIIERPVPVSGGLASRLKPLGPASELQGALAVRVAIVDEFGIDKGYARARYELKRGVPATASVLERDRLAKLLAHDLVHAIDRALSQSITENLAGYGAS